MGCNILLDVKWIGISGSWRYQPAKMHADITAEVTKILKAGDGIVTGGALGADFIATETALKVDPPLKKLKILLPTPLERYLSHYEKRVKEGVISDKQYKILATLLKKVEKTNPKAIKCLNHRTVTKRTYYLRNKAVVDSSDRLIAFCVNESLGTMHTINFAQKTKKPVKLYTYKLTVK